MGNTIWVEIHGRPVAETAEDNSVLYALLDPLDALADRLAVPKLSGFCDYSELEAQSADPPEEDTPEQTLDQRQASGNWSDAAAGAAAVDALRRHLTANFEDLGFKPGPGQSRWPAALMNELARVETLLDEAAVGGQRFRLLIVA